MYMDFREARRVSEEALYANLNGMFAEPVEVRRRAWPDDHQGIIWDEAPKEDRQATDWYIVKP